MMIDSKCFLWLAYHGFLNKWSDEKFIKRKFEAKLGYPLNLDNPQTFNEKLQWLKLHDRKSIYTMMVDKFEVKKYVASIIGEEYIIPTLGIWESFDKIDFDSLPNQFVLKCTHDSGGLIIVKDKSKMNKKIVRKKIEHSLKNNYYYLGREWPYKDVKPRVIAETYMEDSGTAELCDYKIHSFNGVPKIVLVCRDRFSDRGMTEDFFDINWNHLDIKRERHPNSIITIERPKELDEMLHLAEILSEKITFLRSDFYIINGKIFFGELTFYPASGFENFIPKSFDEVMGEWIALPQIIEK